MNICMNANKWKTKHCFSGYLRKWLHLNLRKNISLSSISSTQGNECRDVNLDYVIYDNNAMGRSPVIVCHGLFGNKKNWRHLCKQINLSSGRMVVAYDAVNHGSSSHNENMSYYDMSYDLVNLLDKLDIKNAILVGHSMGGKTVMTTALSYPNRIEKLVVVDTSPRISKSMGEVMIYLQAMDNIDMSKITSRKMVEDELEAVAPSVSLRQFLMSNLQKSEGIFSWRLNLKAIEQNYHYIHSFPNIEADAKFVNPTLFIGGGRSNYITEAEYPAILNYFPIAEIEHVADAGHWVHSEKPSEFLKLVLPFIS